VGFFHPGCEGLGARLHDAAHSAGRGPKERGRHEADPKHKHDERQERREFVPGEIVGCGRVGGMAMRAVGMIVAVVVPAVVRVSARGPLRRLARGSEEHPFDGPQHVPRAEHDAGHADDTPPQARWNDPARIMNSPTNPLRPGRPMLENVNSMNRAASHGAFEAMPPRLAMFRV
jgi:hypothetical protein